MGPAFVPSGIKPLGTAIAQASSAQRRSVTRRRPVAGRYGPALACLAFASSFMRGFGVSDHSKSQPAAESCSATATGTKMSTPSSLKELTGLKAIDGSEIPASIFDGKVTLAVNVASACGYTNSGYAMMKEIGEEFSPHVLVVAIPCNAFGMQENGSPSEIQDFAKGQYDSLLVTERIQENPVEHPIFAIGAAKLPGKVAWNFDGKYLFNKNGEPVKRFDNSATAADIREAIKVML